MKKIFEQFKQYRIKLIYKAILVGNLNIFERLIFKIVTGWAYEGKK